MLVTCVSVLIFRGIEFVCVLEFLRTWPLFCSSLHLWVNYLLPWMWINSLLPIVVVLVEEEMMMTTIGANGQVHGFYNFKKQQTTPKHRNTLVILLSTLEMGSQSLMRKI